MAPADIANRGEARARAAPLCAEGSCRRRPPAQGRCRENYEPSLGFAMERGALQLERNFPESLALARSFLDDVGGGRRTRSERAGKSAGNDLGNTSSVNIGRFGLESLEVGPTLANFGSYSAELQPHPSQLTANSLPKFGRDRPKFGRCSCPGTRSNAARFVADPAMRSWSKHWARCVV